MADAVKRLNYFDHQFLRAQDFNDEQKYHVSLRRRLNSVLHTWGIAQGLNVTLTGGGTGTSVTVSSGMALDSLGQEIVLSSDTPLELSGQPANSTVYITIAYNEEQSDPTSEAGGAGNTRWSEQPRLSIGTSAPGDASMSLILAKVPRTNTGLGAIDLSDRRSAGVVVSPDLTVNSLTLKKDGVAQNLWPKFICGGANQAVLSNGNLGVGAAAPGERLQVEGGSAFVNGENNGVIVDSAGAQRVGLMKYPGKEGMLVGDSRLASPVRLGRFTGGTIKSPASTTDDLVINSTGNVGIGTATISAKLEVLGTAWDQHLKLTNTTQSGGGPAIYFNGANRSWAIVGTNSSASAGDQRLGFYDVNVNQYRMVIDASGNIGMGTNAPDRGFTMFRAGTGTGVYGNIKNGTHEVLIGVDAAAIVSAMTNSDLQLRTNNTNRVVISAGTGTLTAMADIRLANSDIYFTRTDHNHSGFGNTAGFAALENAANYGALMILGRSMPNGRIVKLWDYLQVNGNLEVTGTASKPGGGTWTALSDKSLKKNISPLGGVLDRLLSLRGVTFEWKDPQKYGNQTGTQVGLVAQEVEKVFPEWIGTDSEGYKTITVRGLEALVIEAFRELKQENQELKEAIAELRAKLDLPAKEAKSSREKETSRKNR